MSEVEEATGVVEFTTSEGNADDARKLTVSFDFGATSARAVELFGEDVVYANYLRGARVTLQGFIRAQLSDVEKSDDDILAAVAEWKPGARSSRAASKTSKAEKIIDQMTDEERTALIAKLQGMNG